ncbi:MAG: group 1 truncated hemoglobin [Mariprofundaceae bacterium]|nr:group 1 truncated hemoglobin [Mariprofundaceae bacterium]
MPGLSVMKQSLFDAVGGLPTLQKVHKIFYDKVYAHPWLKSFFEGHSQEAIENRQTQFMGEKMGGHKYTGRALDLAHRRMYITKELLEVRQALLGEALEDAGVPQKLGKQWLKIDRAFWKQLINDSSESFGQIDLKYERPLIVPKPEDMVRT